MGDERQEFIKTMLKSKDNKAIKMKIKEVQESNNIQDLIALLELGHILQKDDDEYLNSRLFKFVSNDSLA